MKIKRKYHFILLTFFSLFSALNLFSQTIAKNGVIDLTAYKFTEQGIVDLNGIWEFYPGELYSPKNFIADSVDKGINVSVPSLWNETFFNKKSDYNIGYGTYRLKVLLPDSIQLLALRLTRIESSYILWVNDDTLTVCGITAKNKHMAKPEQKTVYKIFAVNSNSFDITIQVSNFYHRKGGIDSPISLGLPMQIVNKTKEKRGFEMFIIGVLLIMAVFHFGLYIVKRKDYSLLFFGLLLIVEMVSMMTNGEVLFTLLFPDMSWVILKKVDYISNFIRLTFFALFFYKLYEEYLSKIFMQILAGINVVLIFIVLFSDLLTYSFSLLVFIGIFSITMLYILYAQIKSIFKKKEGALIPFIGTFVLLLAAVNDILYVSDIIETMFLIPFGLFIFIFTQSYVLSFNFSNLYKKTEELNKMIANLDEVKNKLLEKRYFKYIESLQIITEYLGGTRGLLFSVSKNIAIFKSEYPKINTNDTLDRYPLSLINETLDTQKTITFANSLTGKYFDKKYLSEFNVKSSSCIPLNIAGKTRAVIYIENNNRRNAFNKQNTDVLTLLSDQIVGIIANIDMYQELESLNLNIETIIKNRTKDIRNQNEMLKEQKDEIETISSELKNTLQEVSEKNNIIKDSISYAKYLQDANLPDDKDIRGLFQDSFILYKPKEIISGDFYWVNNIDKQKKEKTILAVADCTGHGVPGALISVMGYDMLNNITINKKIKKPSEILNELQKEIIERLSEKDEAEIQDGMEIAIVSYDQKNNVLEYAGARINFVIFRNNKMTEVKADRMSISAVQHGKYRGQKFSNHSIKLKKDDIVYLFSDGFQDQFGGENDTKFMKKNFRVLLNKVNQLQFSIQRSHMLKALNQWQGKSIQNDDILVVGLKF